MLPDWNDESDALVDYVSQAISDLLCGPNPERSKQEYGVWPFGHHSGIKEWDMLEREAVEAAEHGNFGPLGRLLESEHLLNHHSIKPPIRAALAPSKRIAVPPCGNSTQFKYWRAVTMGID